MIYKTSSHKKALDVAAHEPGNPKITKVGAYYYVPIKGEGSFANSMGGTVVKAIPESKKGDKE